MRSLLNLVITIRLKSSLTREAGTKRLVFYPSLFSVYSGFFLFILHLLLWLSLTFFLVLPVILCNQQEFLPVNSPLSLICLHYLPGFCYLDLQLYLSLFAPRAVTLLTHLCNAVMNCAWLVHDSGTKSLFTQMHSLWMLHELKAQGKVILLPTY